MIEYKIQLRNVIRDKIQSETKFSQRQNSVQDKAQSEAQNPRKISFFCRKKNLSENFFCFGCCLGQIDANHH